MTDKKEYIERGALLENLKKQYGEELGWQCTVNMSDVEMMLEDAPTADVVEVVRCKDCAYDNEDNMQPHSGWCEYLERGEYNEHYCNYGERRMI